MGENVAIGLENLRLHGELARPLPLHIRLQVELGPVLPPDPFYDGLPLGEGGRLE